MFKVIILAAALAVARAGYLGAPAALHAGPVATYAAAAPVAHYSAAPAVSSSYLHQTHNPAVAAVHAAPAIAAVHAAPAFGAIHAAPAYSAVHAAPAYGAVHAGPAFGAIHAAPAYGAIHAAHAYAAPAYAAPVAYHTPSIGASQQSVLRSLGGNQAVSHYSKAVDSAFSSVRKYDTRITNDALAVAPVAHYAHAAPAIATSYAAPLGIAHGASLGYAHASPLGYAHASPLGYAHGGHLGYAHAAPVATYAAHAPVIAKTAAVAYSPAAVVSHAAFTGFGAHYAW